MNGRSGPTNMQEVSAGGYDSQHYVQDRSVEVLTTDSMQERIAEGSM